MSQLTPIRLKWGPAPFDYSNRLTEILAKWEGTRYADQIPSKNGASCFGFICAVLDELDGTDGESGDHLVGLPSDIAFKTPDLARAAMKWFLTRYTAEPVTRGCIEPGDLLVTTSTSNRAPGHVMMVGPRENTIWHSTEAHGVHYIGMSLPSNTHLHSIYRIASRELWQPN